MCIAIERATLEHIQLAVMSTAQKLIFAQGKVKLKVSHCSSRQSVGCWRNLGIKERRKKNVK